MITIVYTLADGRVYNITSGSYTQESLIEAYGEDYGFIEVESLPSTKQYRQYLAVEGGQLVVKDMILTAEQEKNIRRMEISDEIQVCKDALFSTDYKTLKYVDGLYTEEEYAIIKAERQGHRDRINALEEELPSLDSNG